MKYFSSNIAYVPNEYSNRAIRKSLRYLNAGFVETAQIGLARLISLSLFLSLCESSYLAKIAERVRRTRVRAC